ncbi:uncharacterized protein F4817DRAFT_341571 [Daldinia loculata]|uniref:uncharacterized protein n=1 Tax=Daldinia loculata TaxID=103429 RepID=UPI0020C46318|nr:uncharacterized protein F4817DRAFT_341571 [Daldinia loculata]KAI1646010.1 hypothetical protein F4817DRAFT_341571 [Daldinia loculata]
MDIYLVRICELPGGSLYVDRKSHATTDDEYIAISHVWGTPETIQKSTVDGIPWDVYLSPGKQDILSLLRRDDVCGNSWFWMDLFCLDQSELSSVKIADQLMAIPSIYKCSRCVKVLIESSVCMEWQEVAFRAFERGPIDEESFQEEELAHGRSCPHFLFADPWFDRLWTRQEGLYACVLDFIVLNPVPCKRHNRDLTSAWIAHGTLLTYRFRAETFLLDKLAYHGLQPSRAEGSLFSLYFDVVYRHHVNVTLAYDCEPGPDPKYNPIMEAWRSQRCTTKTRDYILAVFPDIDGYNLPVGARKMSFSELLLNAIRQPAVRANFQIAPKIPRGMVSPSDKDIENILPWLTDIPLNIGQAYDTFAAYRRTSKSEIRNSVIPGNIALEDIDISRSGLDILKDDWQRTTDIFRHVALVSPSGPCTGTTRQEVTSNDTGLLRQHLAQEFMPIAVSQYLRQEEMHALELRTKGVLTFDRIRDIPEEAYGRELKRFLVCLICGTSLPTADEVLEKADVVRVSTPYGPLLGIIHRETRWTIEKSRLMLVCGQTWDLQGFYIGVRVDGKMSARGRTIIPNSSVWDSIEKALKT